MSQVGHGRSASERPHARPEVGQALEAKPAPSGPLWSALALHAPKGSPGAGAGDAPAAPPSGPPASSDIPAVTPELPERLAHSRGEPLAPALARGFGRALRHDLSQVRLHQDSAAAQAADALAARAFTLGHHVYLGAGAPPAASGPGQAMLAHELHHAVQFDRGQLGASAGPGPGRVGDPAGLRVAGPASAAEREAGRVASGDLHGLPARPTATRPGARGHLILRIPSDLPQTAGGFRLGRHLDAGAGDALWGRLRDLLDAEDLDGLDAEYQQEFGSAPVDGTFADTLWPAWDPAEQDLVDLPDPVGEELLDDWHDDVATLVFERFHDAVVDFDRLAAAMEMVGATYRNLAYLRQNEEQDPRVVPPGGEALGDWFRSRARIFLTHALLAPNPDLYAGVLAALAAETERMAHQDPSGPVETARVLVGTLFERGISQETMDAVASLYSDVLIHLSFTRDTQQTRTLHALGGRLGGPLGQDVLAVERRLRDAGDQAEIDRFHRELRELIAPYLATVRADDHAADLTTDHMHALYELLLDWSGGPTLEPVLIWFDDAVWATSPDDEAAADSDDAATPDTAPQATTTPAPTVPALPPRPAPPPLPTESLDSADLEAWLRQYWEDRPAFFARRFDGPALLRGMGPPTPPFPTAWAQRRVDQWRALVIQILQRLDRHLTSAIERAERIHGLRLEHFPSADVDAQVCLLGDEQGAPVEPPPDYLSYFALPAETWYVLGDALQNATFDGGTFVERLVLDFADYYEALHLYQSTLERALELTARMRATGADQLIVSDFPDDYGPQVQRLLATAETSPAWTTRTSDLQAAAGLEYSLDRLGLVTDRAEATLRVRHEQELETRIAERLPAAVTALWAAEDAEHRTRTDAVRLDQVWPDPLRPLVDVPTGLEAVAPRLVEYALRQFNAGTLQRLGLEAGQAATDVDTLRVAALMARISALQSRLGTTTMNAGLEALQQFNRANTEYLLLVFVVAQTQLSLAAGDGRLPGHVARTGRVLQLGLRQPGNSTLHDVVRDFSGLEGELAVLGLGQQNASEVIEGTRLSSIFDTLPTGMLYPYELMGIAQEIESDSGDAGSVLFHLLAAESAGGGEARGAALAETGELLRARGTSGCLMAARLLYASALNVGPRIHEVLKPKPVVDAETFLNRRMVSSGPSDTDPLERAAVTREERDAQRVIREYREASDSTMEQLDQGMHPVENRPLTTNERVWWEAYKDVSGRGHILPGEEGWAETRDFLKEAVFLGVVMYASGGIGSALTEVGGGGAVLGLGASALEVAAVTEATRLRQSLVSGVDPTTPLWEDLLVNAATMGATKLALGAYGSAFNLTPATEGLARHALGRFAAEYAATSVVSRLHLSISSSLHGTPLTDDDVRRSYLTNFAFMVAFKARDLLGEAASAALERALNPDRARALQAVLARLHALDVEIDGAATEAREARTQVERDAALDRQQRALRAKERLLRGSGAEELRSKADDFGTAVGLFEGEAARARVFGAINVENVPGTRDMTYSRGAASEGALTEHLSSSGAEFRVIEGLHGLIFEIHTPDGPVRLSPREAQLAGATTGETFVHVGRPEGELLRSGDNARLAEILSADARLPRDVRRQLEAGATSFRLTRAGAEAHVQLVLVDAFSSDLAGHDPGPARYRIRFENGRFEVAVEALTTVSNDQLGRGVDHEIREVNLLLDALVRDAHQAGEPLSRYQARAVLERVLEREAGAGVLGRGTAAAPTAHDVATLYELQYLSQKMRELRAELDARPDPAEASALRARLEVLDAEYRRTFRASGLAADVETLTNQIRRFEDAGVEISADLRTALEEGSYAMSQGWESRGGLRMLDVHVIFGELQRAHANLMEGVTLADFVRYYESRVAARAQAVYDAEMAQHHDADRALARAAESAREMLGPTSIPSMRGRAFEGLSAAELNADPLFRTQHGQIHTLTNPSFPGFDAVSVRGNVRGVDIDETPVHNADGSTTAQLRVTERGTGTQIFRWVDGRPPTITTAAGYDVGLWSAKARGGYDLGNLYRTMGSARTPHPAAHGLGTPEFHDALRRSVDWAQTRVTNLQREVAAGDASKVAELNRWRTRLADLQHFEGRLATSGAWTNERIDALLREARDRHVDVDAIIAGLDLHEEAPAQ